MVKKYIKRKKDELKQTVDIGLTMIGLIYLAEALKNDSFRQAFIDALKNESDKE